MHMLLENTFRAGKVVLEERLVENYSLERVIITVYEPGVLIQTKWVRPFLDLKRPLS